MLLIRDCRIKSINLMVGEKCGDLVDLVDK